MAKWKYQDEEKQNLYTNFGNKLFFKVNEPKKITITNWEFLKGEGPSFKCFVEKEDGHEVDKTWAVWDFESKERLKKRLKGLRPAMDKAEIEVVMKEEEMERYFEVLN